MREKQNVHTKPVDNEFSKVYTAINEIENTANQQKSVKTNKGVPSSQSENNKFYVDEDSGEVYFMLNGIPKKLTLTDI